MSKQWRKILLITLSIAGGSAAHAGVLFGVKGGTAINMLTASASGVSASYDTVIGYGGGAALDVGTPGIGAMLDVLYMRRGYGFLGTSSTLGYLHVPLQARFGLGAMLLTVGGYYAQVIGDVSTPLGSASADTVGLATSDYGITAGVGARFGGRVKFSIEGRVNYGLADVSTSTSSSDKWMSFDVLAGIWF